MVLGAGLDAVVAVAEGLPVALIPEEQAVAAVRDDVVNVRRPDVPALLHALHTQRVRFKVTPTGLLPCPAVTPVAGAPHLLRVERLVGIAVFLPMRYERGAAGMTAGCVRTVRYICHLLSFKYQQKIFENAAFLSCYLLGFRI